MKKINIKQTALMVTLLVAGTTSAYSAACDQETLDACVKNIIDAKNKGKPREQWVAPSWMTYQGYEQQCAKKLNCDLSDKKPETVAAKAPESHDSGKPEKTEKGEKK